MRTRTSPKRGCRSGAGIAWAAALFCALSAGAQGTGTKAVSPKRDAPSPPTSGSVVSYQESRGAGIVYLEEKGGMSSGVASPVKFGDGSPADVPVVATTPVAAATKPANAPVAKLAPVAVRKAPAVTGTVAQSAATPDPRKP
jgi:hypothetical protein